MEPQIMSVLTDDRQCIIVSFFTLVHRNYCWQGRVKWIEPFCWQFKFCRDSSIWKSCSVYPLSSSFFPPHINASIKRPVWTTKGVTPFSWIITLMRVWLCLAKHTAKKERAVFILFFLHVLFCIININKWRATKHRFLSHLWCRLVVQEGWPLRRI